MLKRIFIVFCVLILLAVALEGYDPSYYRSMNVQNVDGQPYLVMGSEHSAPEDCEFSIYRPKDKSPAEWEAVAPDRIGVPTGVYVSKVEKPDHTSGERLGVFHRAGTTLFDFSQKTPQSTHKKLPFEKWTAETTGEIDGVLYAFGVQLPDSVGAGDIVEGPLKVARWTGDAWEELNGTGPLVQFPLRSMGFFLRAVSTGDSIKVLWRTYENDQALGIEGPRATTDGLLQMASFGKNGFEPNTIGVRNLPRGNMTTWSDGQNIKMLLQTRMRPEESMLNNGPMEIWTIQPDGKAELSEPIEGSQAKSGLFSFISAERFVWNEREYILRSNWQIFQVWEKTPGQNGSPGTWAMITNSPKGLPVYDLQSTLFTYLAIALGLVLSGVFVAYRRRKQAWTLMRRIQAHEIYADLGLRISAYLVDVVLVICVVLALGQIGLVRPASLVRMMTISLTEAPFIPFLVAYVIYFCGAEWLAGATFGKFIMGLRVVMDGGRPLSLWAAIVRNVVGFIERLPLLVPFVAMTMILFSPRRQRLGDILSRSFVVHKVALEAFKAQREEELAKQNAALAAAGPGTLPQPASTTAPAVPPPAATNIAPNAESKDKGPQQ